MCCFGLACLVDLICCCCDDENENQQSSGDQPGWMGAGTGDMAMSDQQPAAQHWDQPPTSGWMGASAGDMGVGGGAPQWDQPPTSGWAAVGQPNLGMDTGEEQPAGVGVSSNNAM